MKPSKVFSSLFFILGTGILIVSIALCLLLRNMETVGRSVPQEAEAAGNQFASALSAGDLEAAADLIYGQPDLGTEASFDSTAAGSIWERFRESISCESGSCYWEGTSLYQDVTLSYLDVPGVMKDVTALAKAAEADESMDGEQRLLDTVKTALAQGRQVTVQGKLRLVEEAGSWYVIPDKTVLSALSGGVK